MEAYWCGQCNVPVLLEKTGQCPCCGNAVEYLATDLRPVFYVEKLILEFYLDKIGKLRSQSIWKHSKNRYYYEKPLRLSASLRADGKRLNLPRMPKLKERLSSLRAFLKEEGVLEKEQHFPLPRLEPFVQANQERLAQITDDAIDFVKRTVAKYPERIVVVSFSGGKDSTVVSHLVRRALGKAEVLHIFSDTTLEDALTYRYVERFRASNPTTPFFIPKSEHDFFEMCNKMGPPTQHNRWCCTIFKTGPISNVLNSFGKNILTFYGVRHAESNARSGYEPISRSKKITKQIVASPIYDALTEPGNVGRIFNLDAVLLSELLMRLSSEYDEEFLRLERTAGLDSIVFRNSLEEPLSALTIYYERRGHHEWFENDFEK